MRLAKSFILVSVVFTTGFVFVQSYGDDKVPERDDKVSVKKIVQDAKSLPLQEYMEVIAALRLSALDRLLEVDPKLKEKWSQFASEKDQGLNKLINRGVVEFSAPIRGGGAYFSFVTKSNSYDKSPQLGMQDFNFSSGFYGGSDGVVIRLAESDIKDVDLENCPKELTYDYERPLSELSRLQRKARTDAFDRGGYTDRTTARVNRVFAVRWASIGEADTLAAFQVVAQDKWTVTIAWKVLKHFDKPKR